MGAFFRFCSTYAVDDLQDLLLRRYNNLDFLLSLEPVEFMDLAALAYQKDREDRLREEWNGLYPFMIIKQIKFIELEDYIDRRTGRSIDNRPADVIMAEIEELHRKGGAHGDF